MKKGFLFFAIGLMLAFSSCNDDKKPVTADNIYMEYELIYEEYSEQMDGPAYSATAKFKPDDVLGFPGRLPEGSDILFNGENLTYDSYRLTYYLVEKGMTIGGEFTVKNLESKDYTNAVMLVPIQLPALMPEITKGEDYTIVWEGAPVGEDEFIVAYLQNDGIPNGGTTALANEEGETAVTFPKSVTSLVYDGSNVKVWLQRVQKRDVVNTPKASGEKGTVIGSYITTKREWTQSSM